MARCIASNTQPADVVLTADWNWTDYTRYFFHRASISLLGQVARDGDPVTVQDVNAPLAE